VQEYQQQLLNSVKRDIQSLHDKFKAQYRASGANHMSQLRDVPEIAGAIIWARQIERQLDVFMKRVQDALGEGWDSYAEGKKLSNERDTFRRKLDTRPLFDAWLHDISRRELKISGRLFDVTRNRATDSFQLSVNFDPQVIALFKEVRNLTWLGFPIPHAISNFAKDAKRVYPYAVSLMETVRTYTQTCAQVRANPTVACLLAQVQNDVHAQISQGMALRWENFGTAYDSHRTAAYLPGAVGNEGLARENKQVLFVRQLAGNVSLFQDTTDELITMQREVNAAVDELSSCAYTLEAFSALLAKIQATIDRLNLEGYPNLDHWVSELDSRIEALLLERLRLISVAWCAAFVREDDSEGNARDSTAVARKGTRNAPQAKVSRVIARQTRLLTSLCRLRLSATTSA
jgi:dynein heavy chain 1